MKNDPSLTPIDIFFCIPAGFHCHSKAVYLKGKFKDESFKSLTRNTDGKMPQLHRAGSRKVHDLNEYAFTLDRFHQRTCSSCRIPQHHKNILALFNPTVIRKSVRLERHHGNCFLHLLPRSDMFLE